MANRDALFKRIDNTLLDMQAATSQTFEQPFLTYARLFTDASLQSINAQLTADLDVDQFLEDSYKTQGGMVGSARLAWPDNSDEVLGLKWLLVQKLAREPQRVLNFAHTFYTVGRNLTGELHSLTRQLLIPFARDYKDYVMTIEPSVRTTSTSFVDSDTTRQVNYHINGNNARVNLHSIDNSINSVTINSAAMNCVQELRNEIGRAELSDEQRTSAVDVVDEIESQIESGKAKPTILAALLASLPTIDSITSIGNNLLQALRG